MATTLTRGVVEFSLNSAVGDGTAGVALGLPKTEGSLGHTIAWQVVYATGTSVSAASTSLQVSMDNSNWATIDTNTNVAGCYRIVTPVIGRFIRAYHTSDTGATTISVSILIQ